MLTTVVFDADETLVDLRPAVTGGLEAVLARMRRLTPAAVGVTLADLESDWSAVFGDLAAAPVAEIRRAALARSLDRADLGGHLDEIVELFFARRFALTRPFADVLPALAALRTQWSVGLATNGNSRAERCGLTGQFAFEVYAHHDGVPKKPDPDFYAAACAAAGADPTQVVHVGDNLVNDVVAAQQAGLRAVWLNRRGERLPADVVPDAVVSTLTELPGALANLSRGVARGSGQGGGDGGGGGRHLCADRFGVQRR
ncbi:HAD family hydrolase [Micromonospora sp. DT48]|uniref:HAD family hydrolase n=1 Tax=unclassified Micromonospora TaxID=2617518 RepID=UPI0012BD2CA7|nr:HAD family hydrolase [Micromonospora sp. CP22]MTK00564.1 HAD family hydrolase [Micromonospora sp. CP22]